MSTAEKLRAHHAITAAAAGLDQSDARQNPLAQFGHWLAQAGEAGIIEPNAMVLATVSAESAPSQRSVLMKSYDENGFVFFTNHGSRKAQQMQENQAVSAVFPWYALHRQVLIEGMVYRISEDESIAYFSSRPRDARLGAWASRQSAPLASRQSLETRLADITMRFDAQEIPLPKFWGGYRIRPQRIEFWQGRPHRLHDRILYTRNNKSNWEISRLYP